MSLPLKHFGLQLSMRADEQCKFLCRIPALSENEAKQFQTRIKEEYRVNMCVLHILVFCSSMRWEAVQ